MKKFAQILYNKAHWIFEAEEFPNFSEEIVIVDITGNEDIREGWEYDSSSGEFSEPIIEPITPKLSEVDELRKYMVELDYRLAKENLSL